MNKHAYLIIAHNQPQLLKMLCQLLDHPCHDIFIHVHAEAKGFDFEEIKNAVKSSCITFIPRVVVRWGGYSLVNCEMNLLKAATAKDTYSYYHLLSGADMPLRSAQQLYEFFEDNSGKEFVENHIADYRHVAGGKLAEDNLVKMLNGKFLRFENASGPFTFKGIALKESNEFKEFDRMRKEVEQDAEVS